MFYEEFEGIVLSSRPHREKDSLLKLFTKEYGKRMFFIRGTRSGKHVLQAGMLPFTKATYLGKISHQGLNFLQDSRNVVHYTKIMEDITLNAYATYVLQLADAALEDNIPAVDLYQLIEDTLWALQVGKSPQLVVHLFELHVLRLFGISFDFYHCFVCGCQQEPFDVSIRHQSVVCQQHFSEDPYRMKTPAKVVHIAQLLTKISPRQLGEITVSKETLQELKRLLDTMYEEYVGIRLKSKKFLDEMERWEEKIKK